MWGYFAQNVFHVSISIWGILFGHMPAMRDFAASGSNRRASSLVHDLSGMQETCPFYQEEAAPLNIGTC